MDDLAWDRNRERREKLWSKDTPEAAAAPTEPEAPWRAVLAERIAARQSNREVTRRDPPPPSPERVEREARRAARRAESEAIKAQRAEDDATFAAHPRPRIRADCEGGARPCPWVGCRHHLALEVSLDTGHIKLAFPDREPWELEHSCALDLAGSGGLTDRDSEYGMTLEQVAATLNVTRERVRQLEAMGLTALRRARNRLI